MKKVIFLGDDELENALNKSFIKETFRIVQDSLICLHHHDEGIYLCKKSY